MKSDLRNASAFAATSCTTDEEGLNMNDYKLWCTHGRFIDIIKLRQILRLQVEDYSELEWGKPLREYIALAKSYISRNQFQNFFQTRKYV